MWRTPAETARSCNSRASAVFAPSGHSVKTCLPARSAAEVSSWCSGTRTHTSTSSTSGCSTSAWALSNAFGMAWRSAVSRAVSMRVVATATTSNSGRACSAGRWARVPHP